MRQIYLSPDLLIQKLSNQKEVLFIFDYDGTLVSLSKDHHQALLEEEQIRLLNTLASSPNTKVAVVTGRSIANLKKLIDTKLSPEIMLYGTHGGEVFVEANYDNEYREHIDDIKSKFEGDPNLYLEIKPLSITVHHGSYPDRDKLQGLLQLEAEKYQDIFRIQKGHNVYEFLPKSINKGLAVLDLHQRFSRYYPVFLGDDLTDNYAFLEINKLGGLSVQVSERMKNLDSGYLINSVEDTYKLIQKYLDQ